MFLLWQFTLHNKGKCIHNTASVQASGDSSPLHAVKSCKKADVCILLFCHDSKHSTKPHMAYWGGAGDGGGGGYTYE